MDFWHGFVVITVVHLLAAASPGPDFAFVTRQSLVHGRKAGLLASIGIALGLSIHIVYSAAGLAAVIAHSSQWMTAIKLAGGAYLIYLGIRGLRSKADTLTVDARVTNAPASAFRQVAAGILCNAFNPKAPVYFLALFTIVLSPTLPTPTLVAYGAWIMLLQWLWFSLVATVFAHPSIRNRLLALRHWIDRAFGVTMVALGLRVLSSVRE
jgi:RhtB (resistance to homoserine/threonine) family protein